MVHVELMETNLAEMLKTTCLLMLGLVAGATVIVGFIWLWNKKPDPDSSSENLVNHSHDDYEVIKECKVDDSKVKVGKDRGRNAYSTDTAQTGSGKESPLSNVEAERNDGRRESDETGSDNEVFAVGSVPCSTPLGLDVQNLDDLTGSLMVKEHERHKLRRHKRPSKDFKETDPINKRVDDSQNGLTGRGNNSDIYGRGGDSVIRADDFEIVEGNCNVVAGKDKEIESDEEVIPSSTPGGLEISNLEDLTSSLMVREHTRHQLRRHKRPSNDSKETQGRRKSGEINSEDDVMERGDNSDECQEGEDEVDGIHIPSEKIKAVVRFKAIIDQQNRSVDETESKNQSSPDQKREFPDKAKPKELEEGDKTP